MIKWCKQDVHQIQYALDKSKNDLTLAEKQLLLKELQKTIDFGGKLLMRK